MPRYAFECEDCELRFERVLKLGEHPTHACPNCQHEADQVMSGFGFAFKAGSGPTANSGVHDLDYPTADKAVGRSADRRWEYVNRREAAKKQARDQGGTHALIRHSGKGFIDYEPMSDRGRVARRHLAKDALKRKESK